jgi:phosphate transport system substrate-binding protein
MKPLTTKRLIVFFVLAVLASTSSTQATAPTSAPAEENLAPAATTALQATTPAEQPADNNSAIRDPGTVFLPEVDPAAVDGAVTAAGSSTLDPLTERMVDRFEDEGFTGQNTISKIGSGAGFERFCWKGLPKTEPLP